MLRQVLAVALFLVAGRLLAEDKHDPALPPVKLDAVPKPQTPGSQYSAWTPDA